MGSESGARLLAMEGTADPQAAAPVDTILVEQALRAVGEALRPLGAQPVAQPGPEAVAVLAGQVEDHLPELVDEQELQRVQERIQPAALTAYLTALREKASQPDDALVASLARQDVLAIGGEMLRRLEPQNGIGFSDGVVSHPDGRHFLLPLVVDFDPGDTHHTFQLMDAVWEQVRQWRAKGVIIEPIGSYRHFDDNMKTLYGDFLATIPVGVTLILIVLWSLARSWGAVGAMYLPALLALITAVAAVAATAGEVPLPLIGFAASLLGVAVDYGVQMTFALRSGGSEHVRSPLLRSFVVSGCAFGVLATSTVPALSSLGLMVLCGLAMAYGSARWLLPAVVRPAARPDPWIGLTGPLLRFCEAQRWRLLLLSGVITLALVPGLFQLHFLKDIQRMDGSRPATREALHDFLDRWGSLESSNFLVDTEPSVDAALGRIRHARLVLGLPPSSVEIAIPDAATQELHRTAWNRFWLQHGADFQRDFASACKASGLRAQGFAQSMQRYQAEPSLQQVTDANWKGTPLSALFDHVIISMPVPPGQPPAYRVASPIEVRTAADMAPIEERAGQHPQEMGSVWIASRTMLASRLVAVLRNDLAVRGIAILAAVGLAVALLVRSPSIILAMLLPPGIALVWTFGILGRTGQELTPFTVLVAAFVGGIGIDCAVFLAQREHRNLLMTPVIGCIATAVAGTVVMLYARHPLLSGVGVTLTIGMTSCLITSLMITPALAGLGRTAAPAPSPAPPTPPAPAPAEAAAGSAPDSRTA